MPFRFLASISRSMVCACALIPFAAAAEHDQNAREPVPDRSLLNDSQNETSEPTVALRSDPDGNPPVDDGREFVSNVWDEGVVVDPPFEIPGGYDMTACCDNDRFWATAEYLYWFTLGQQIPPLVTTSSAGTSQASAGVLGQPSTSVLLGDDRLVTDGQSGGRLLIGFWLDECRDVGVDFLYTGIGEQVHRFSASSSQFPILARPFFNVSSNTEDARLLGFENIAAGNVSVRATTQYQVFEALIRRPVSNSFRTPTYLVYGYRYAELEESLAIGDSSTSLSGPTAGSTLAISDDFQTRNSFNGFEAGLLTSFRFSNCWQLSISGKVAFGETRTVTTITGQSVSANATGATATTSGGLLTQGSNIGRFKSNSHGVQQDFSLRLRRYLQRGVTANFGYGIHRWIDVQRAGEQIDPFVNPTQIPPGTLVGAARPQPRNQVSDFVAQGLTFGLEYNW